MKIIKVSNGIKNTLGCKEIELIVPPLVEIKNYRERALIAFNLAKLRVEQAFPKLMQNDKEINALIFKSYIKAQKKNNIGKSFNEEDRRFYHVDHIIPLKGKLVSGLHVPWNLHVIDSVTNQAKGISIVEEYSNKDIISQRKIQEKRLEISKNNKLKFKEEKKIRRKNKKDKKNKREVSCLIDFLYATEDM